MEQYDPTRAMRLVSEFTVEHLSNWYVRRNRRRFWKGSMSEDKLAAYQTLYECLIAVTKLMAPLAPFLSERVYRSLNNVTHLEPTDSVHLAMIPDVDSTAIDNDLERRMLRAQKIVALARMLREKSRLKVRQPLRRILIPVSGEAEAADIAATEEILRDELNVKAVETVDADASTNVVRRRAKGNFKVLGPKFGKQVKEVAAAIASLSSGDITRLQRDGSLTLARGEYSFDLLPEDVEIVYDDIEGWLVASDGPVTVALDTEVDDDLLREGMAREFVNRVQNLRKDSGLEVTDRIRLSYSAEDTLALALESLRDYIMLETLAVEFGSGSSNEASEFDVNGQSCKVSLVRA
jgi:isoleucyl-tRNA synthetase